VSEGAADGCPVGIGVIVGASDGSWEGICVGLFEGLSLGLSEGCKVGIQLGLGDGAGDSVGSGVLSMVGGDVSVGVRVGCHDGDGEGAGDSVGPSVSDKLRPFAVSRVVIGFTIACRFFCCSMICLLAAYSCINSGSSHPQTLRATRKTTRGVCSFMLLLCSFSESICSQGVKRHRRLLLNLRDDTLLVCCGMCCDERLRHCSCHFIFSFWRSIS
jgi:hypothetical protein